MIDLSAFQRKYVPNLKRLQATCDVNYAHLLALLPEVDEDALVFYFDDGKRLAYHIQILDVARFTTTLLISQQHKGLPSYLQPSMQVRMYHDVRMAEVLQSQHISAIKPSYSYPNKRMLARNEKEMVNLFLTEWLHFCQQHSASSSATDH